MRNILLLVRDRLRTWRCTVRLPRGEKENSRFLPLQFCRGKPGIGEARSGTPITRGRQMCRGTSNLWGPSCAAAGSVVRAPCLRQPPRGALRGHGLGIATSPAKNANRVALRGGLLSGTADAVADLFLASTTRLSPSSAEFAQGQIKESQFPFSSNQFLLGQTKPRAQRSCPPVILWFALAGRGSFGKPEPVSCSACCSVYPRLSPGNALMDIIRPGKHLELLSSVRADQTATG